MSATFDRKSTPVTFAGQSSPAILSLVDDNAPRQQNSRDGDNAQVQLVFPNQVPTFAFSSTDQTLTNPDKIRVTLLGAPSSTAGVDAGFTLTVNYDLSNQQSGFTSVDLSDIVQPANATIVPSRNIKDDVIEITVDFSTGCQCACSLSVLPQQQFSLSPNNIALLEDVTPLFTANITSSQFVAARVEEEEGNGDTNVSSSLFSKGGFRYSCNTSVGTTIIKIKAQTDHYGASNLAQAVMSVYYPDTTKKPLQLSKYFLQRFTEYVIDSTTRTNCTLISKAWSISNDSVEEKFALQTLGKITTYGLLRWFLWYLITGQKNLNILLDSRTETFYSILQASDYSEFMAAFLPPSQIAGYNVYFKKTLPIVTTVHKQEATSQLIKAH